MIKLTPKQQEIVNCDSKYCLVSASAGSGKTLVLTKRIERLLGNLQNGEKILALTFTNKAANELKDRLLNTYSENDLSTKVFVGTIHSFCAEFVTRRGSTIGLPPDLHVFESTDDRLAIFADAVEAVPQVHAVITSDKALRQLFEDVGRAKRSESFREEFLADSDNRMVFSEYKARMLNQHAIDFDDMLAYAARILIEQPALATLYQRVYRHICIDEAQDLNDAQYQVIKALAGNSCGIMMVGDSRQAIYGFNGSTVSIMTNRFPKDYQQVVRFELEENFRSSRAVMRFALAIEHTSQMTAKLAIDGEASCHEFENEEAEAQWIVGKILDLNANGSARAALEAVPLDSIAVLARNRYVFSPLRKALDEHRVSYSERTAGRSGAASESSLFTCFHAGLRLIVNSNDQLHLDMLNRELLPAKPYTSFDEVLADSMPYNSMTPEASNSLRRAWSALSNRGAPRLDLALSTLKGICDQDGAFSDDNDRLLSTNDCSQWTRWWEKYCLSSNPSSRTLDGFLRALSLGVILDEQKGDGVTLSTIHLAKGLEYDVIFVIGLNDGTFPDYRARSTAQHDEERHSMFVAITRSKRLCYVTRPKVRVMPWGGLRAQNPSPFFSELKAVEHEDILKTPCG